MEHRYDAITIKAELSKEGWIIDRPIITRSGIFTYHNKNGKQVREYRPDEEVFKEDSLNTLRGAPITDGHKGIISTDSSLDGLIVGSVMGPGVKDNTNVVADIVIHNVKKIGSKRELSLGYQCKVDETPGEFNGQKYDAVQRDITYNHLAVVHKGRAGNARIRLDSNELASFETETEDMPDPTLIKLRLDNGLEYHASPEVMVYVNSLTDKSKGLQTKLDQTEAERDTLKADNAKLKKDHEAALKTERESARSRITLEDKAKQLDLKFDGVSDRELKEQIIKKLGNDLDFKDRSDDYVDSAFDITISKEGEKNTKTANQKTRINTTSKQDNSSGSVSSLDARARMIARIRGEKKEVA
jgi:hypothetical protein